MVLKYSCDEGYSWKDFTFIDVSPTINYTHCIYIHVYSVHVVHEKHPDKVSVHVVRDQLKTWPVLKPSDGFKAGRTALKRARRLRNGPDGFPT